MNIVELLVAVLILLAAIGTVILGWRILATDLVLLESSKILVGYDKEGKFDYCQYFTQAKSLRVRKKTYEVFSTGWRSIIWQSGRRGSVNVRVSAEVGDGFKLLDFIRVEGADWEKNLLEDVFKRALDQAEKDLRRADLTYISEDGFRFLDQKFAEHVRVSPYPSFLHIDIEILGFSVDYERGREIDTNELSRAREARSAS